jgi:glycosyltransferase involved in cell wall biosynthesis
MMPTVLDARVLCGSGGGPDKTLLHSPPFLARAGYRMACAYLHDPADPGFGVFNEKARALGVDLISVPDHGPLDWRVVPRMLEVCRRERVAIWHGHDYKTNALGLVLRQFHPMRLVSTVHGWVHQTNRTPLYYFIDRLSLRFYEQVLCVSTDLMAACRQAGIPAGRLTLLENGIDVAAYRRARTAPAARTVLGLPDRFTIGAAGRLSAEKGFDILIRATDGLLAAGHDIQLWIAGAGAEREALGRLIADTGRGDRIRLLGYQSDPVTLYEASDVYALSSTREGFPNVLLEAMALEVPVVATAVNGVPQLVTHGETGELVASGSAEALAAGLARLIAEPDRRARYAAAGRRVVEERFSFAARMDTLAGLYDEMGLRAGAPSPARYPRGLEPNACASS